MSNELSEVFSGLLHSQHKNDSLLSPVSRLEQVIKLEDSLVRFMREALIHPSSIEIPYWCTAHYI
jgi:hypothetical protein